MPILELTFACGESSLSVRRFSVHETVSGLFTVSVWARSESPSIDLEAIIGQPASLRVVSGWLFARLGGARLWTGIVSSIEQVQAVQPASGAKELSTYSLRIVPDLWMLTQRRNYRIFQHLSIPDIVDELLDDWGIDKVWEIDRGKYPKLEYKVQYGESDFAFFGRLLEEAGIGFTFADDDAKGSKLTLSDKLESNTPRPGGALPYVDNPNQEAEKEFVSGIRLSYGVRPGAHTIRDYDFRNPSFELFGEAPKAKGQEAKYEQYHYEPGAFLVEGGKGGGTPAADDKGVARYDQGFGKGRATRLLGGTRVDRRVVSFDTNTIDLWPGEVFSIDRHPHADITESTKLLVTEFSVEGTPEGEWSMSGQAVFTDAPYRPPQRTPKPRVEGVQSARVVGPNGQEIHTDEFGRVRVQFPWDREGKNDDNSSCWIRVSQGWAGTGYGMIVLPRIGQEVMVGFLEGDPDQPIIVGRVYNAKQAVPYKLPEHKTRSMWKSDSSLGSDGFNEIMFEDLKGQELVYEQAQKNRRRLVKNDETITIGHDRQKLVKNDESEKTLGFLKVYVGKDQDIVVKQNKRERIEGDSHLRVYGKRNQRIEGKQSLTVKGDRHELVGKNYAIGVNEEIHVAAGTAIVIEAGKDLTIKGPGGFVRIDQSGVTIRGKQVRINSGGSPGSGKGSSPDEPEEAIEAEVDDVSVTLIGQ
ncbi:type VI secretion system Vgr family protein [Polyangium jinanense]|uniref:Type VI secretion system tip protein VgrG n=1 Tax=Polyangium jinanense TaxID=2829994 RepID=A0A9X3XCD3_9BACT|nr:type VI secretion system tip protein TssI/VgrG [Polyangium jinanense]MDC3960502.1 type VI secretion system tip protein VgrG [Polyangium jinanense]MDC3986725.1 type VI secretion system tip protein VgrG [Polyangium jinanense]